MPRTRTTTSREEKVEELLDVAEDLFARNGFAGTSTAQLAQAAAVSEKTLFWYFPSKDHLLVAVVERRTSLLLAGLRRAGWPTGDLAEDLFRVLRALRSIRHLLPFMHQRAEVAECVATVRNRVRAANQRAIADGLRSLGVPEGELDDAVVIVVSFADGVLIRQVAAAKLRRLCRTLVERLGGQWSRGLRERGAIPAGGARARVRVRAPSPRPRRRASSR